MASGRSRFRPRAAATIAALLAGIPLAACGHATPAAQHPATYYLSPSGDDSASGTSPAAPWRTLGRASSAVLRPGTRLLLQGGRRFTGQLTLGPRDGGDPAKPVVIGAYGSGTPTIVARRGAGVMVYDTGGIDIHSLDLAGEASGPRSTAGITVYSDLRGSRRLSHIQIRNIGAHNFEYGISLGSRGRAGFRDVSIIDATLHGNAGAGLETYGPPFDAASPSYANENIHIARIRSYDNRGDPEITAYSSGSGIVLGSVKDASVAWSTAYDNGGAGRSVPGPEGIWAYDSTGVVIEHNLSYGTKTWNRIDGNGFGLDQNVSDSYLQYNFSYGNAGAGYLLYSRLKNGAQKDNVVRFNISLRDGQSHTSRFGGITLYGRVRNTSVYQNTVIAGSPPDSLTLVLGKNIRHATVRNNIFLNHSGPVVIAPIALPESTVLMQGNDYFSAARTWDVQWGTTLYTSLSSWQQGSGQEMVSGQPAGFAVNPGLANPFLRLSPATATLLDLSKGFALRPGSPLVHGGLDLHRLFGIEAGKTTFSGDPVPSASPNVGAE